MKRLGTALHVIQNRLIVRSEQIEGTQNCTPRIGSWVVDQKRMRVGKVFEMFGPVKHPFIIVKPNREFDIATHVGKKLYVDEASGRDGKWKR